MVQTPDGSAPAYPYDIFTDQVLSDPHPHYRTLRELGPVVWLEAHGMYVLPRYAQARAALADPGRFCSGQGVGLNDVINGLAAGGNTLTTDGEVHDHLRGVIGPGLTPRALRGMRDSVEQQASDLVAGLAQRGSFDAVTDLARALPLSVVPDLIGLPAVRPRPAARVGRRQLRPDGTVQRSRRAGLPEGPGDDRVRRPYRRRRRRRPRRAGRGDHRRSQSR